MVNSESSKSDTCKGEKVGCCGWEVIEEEEEEEGEKVGCGGRLGGDSATRKGSVN